MARLHRVLTSVLALALASLPALAQETVSQSPDRETDNPAGEREKGKRDGKRKMSPEMQNVRRAIEALSPEQRKRFEENFHKWANLPAEEKKSLRDREEVRRKRMADDIQAALAKSGLTLDEEQKAHFARRYVEERRKLEEELRREMDEKRQPRLDGIVGELTKEFSCGSGAPQ